MQMCYLSSLGFHVVPGALIGGRVPIQYEFVIGEGVKMTQGDNTQFIPFTELFKKEAENDA
jgi:hypothetical protein